MADPQTKREIERLALEAARLKNDETLKIALANIRSSAVDALIKADATKTADVIRFQAKVQVCDEFMGELETMIQLQTIETGSRING